MLLKYKDLNWNILDQIVVSGSNFINIIIVARLLGLEQFGEFSVLWLFILFINSLHMAMIVFPMMSLVPKQKELLNYFGGLYRFQFIFILISSIFIFIITISFYNIKNEEIDINMIIQFILVLASYHMQDYYRKYFLVLKKYYDAFIIDVISYIFRVILFLGILLFDIELSLTGVLIMYSITYLLGIFYGAGKYMSVSNKSSLKTVYLEHWALSKWLIPSGVMQWTSINLYLIASSVILGPVAVGVIRLAQNIIGALNVILLGIENHLPTKFSHILIDQGLDNLKSYFKKVIFLGLVGLIFSGSILSIFSKDLMVLLYGNEYSQYDYIIVWYAIIFIFMFLIVPIRGMLRTLNATKIWFNAYLITSVFSIILFYPLETGLGINGVMLGILISHMLLIIIASTGLYKIIKEKYAD